MPIYVALKKPAFAVKDQMLECVTALECVDVCEQLIVWSNTIISL